MVEINISNIDKYELISFDIFDTLITRMTATPLGIFSIMQEIINNSAEFIELPSLLKENFYTIRHEIEVFVRENYKRNFNSQEIILDNIYDFIKNNYNLSLEQTNSLKLLEINTEQSNLIPIQNNLDLLCNLKNKGKKIILISDMYHSEAVIRNFLLKINEELFKDITIYVSSEYNKTKCFKDLYRYVKDQEQVDYCDWLHIGDNSFADIQCAEDLGINTNRVSLPKAQKYEIDLLNSSSKNYEDKDIQITLGISRACSLDKICSKVYSFGASFASPLLYGYVDWLLIDAQKRNLNTLYFIARDGYILKKIADEVIKINNYPLKTKYIYGSRRAWRIPNENTIDDILNWSFSEYPHKQTIQFTADRLNLTVEDIEEFFAKKIKNKNKKTKKYFNIDLDFKNNDKFKKMVISKNLNKLDTLKAYLMQEINFEEQFAFVDFNGSGRTQDCIANILDRNILTYYFYSEFNIKEKSNSRKLLYFSNKNYHNHCMELLCRAPEGQCLGYKKNTNYVEPILEECNKEILIDWGFNDYIAGILDFTNKITNYKKNNNIYINTINIYKHYFKYLFNKLDKETANIIGDIPYLEIGNEKEITKCARKLTLLDFIRMVLCGNKYIKKDLCFISLKRSNKMFKNLYDFNKKYGSILRLLFDIKFSNKNKYYFIRILGISIKIRNKKFGDVDE